MKIKYYDRIINLNDQQYILGILSKISGIDNIKDKILLEEELFNEVKERYGIPKENSITLIMEKELNDLIVIYNLGKK